MPQPTQAVADELIAQAKTFIASNDTTSVFAMIDTIRIIYGEPYSASKPLRDTLTQLILENLNKKLTDM